MCKGGKGAHIIAALPASGKLATGRLNAADHFESFPSPLVGCPLLNRNWCGPARADRLLHKRIHGSRECSAPIIEEVTELIDFPEFRIQSNRLSDKGFIAAFFNYTVEIFARFFVRDSAVCLAADERHVGNFVYFCLLIRSPQQRFGENMMILNVVQLPLMRERRPRPEFQSIAPAFLRAR